MRIAYFHQASADNDDEELGAAKVLGYVPDTCLLGGRVVWLHVDRGADPCASCGGPRPRCGGRERTETGPYQMDNESRERIRRMFLGDDL